MFNPKWIIGKTVKSVSREPSVIRVYFTDGSHVTFSGHDDGMGDDITIAEADYCPAPKSAASGAPAAREPTTETSDG